jgi:hypothetical protein
MAFAKICGVPPTTLSLEALIFCFCIDKCLDSFYTLLVPDKKILDVARE